MMLEQVRQLLPSGIPVLVVGDMNEHGEIYCDLAGGAGLTSPSGNRSRRFCSTACGNRNAVAAYRARQATTD